MIFYIGDSNSRFTFGWLIVGGAFFWLCNSWINKHPNATGIFHLPMETLAIEIMTQVNANGANNVFICGANSELMQSTIILSLTDPNTGVTSNAFEMTLPQQYSNEASCRQLAAKVAAKARSGGRCEVFEVRTADNRFLSYVQCTMSR